MNDLTLANPELAEDVWVFNSFFYKKINQNHKDPIPQETPFSVRVLVRLPVEAPNTLPDIRQAYTRVKKSSSQ